MATGVDLSKILQVITNTATQAATSARQNHAETTPSGLSTTGSSEDPEIMPGVKKSDLIKLMAIQSMYGRLAQNPNANPAVKMALSAILQSQTKEVMGKLIGDNNVSTLYSAMQNGPIDQQEYIQRLGGMQKKVNDQFKQQQSSEMFNRVHGLTLDGKDTTGGLYGGHSMYDSDSGPAWKQQLYAGTQAPDWFKNLPVEQQQSLLGPSNQPFQGMDKGKAWTPPVVGGQNLAPNVRYNADTKSFERTDDEHSER